MQLVEELTHVTETKKTLLDFITNSKANLTKWGTLSVIII
jgi:hypothetical protein